MDDSTWAKGCLVGIFIGLICGGGAGVLAGVSHAEKKEHRRAVEACVGYWEVDQDGNASFRYGVKETGK